MKILITGGRGFIGRRLQKALERDPSNEVSLLVLNKDKDRGDEKLKSVILGDICDGSLDISEFDLVYHLAAMANPRACEQNKELAWKINVEGTRNVAEKVRKGAKIVFMSSAHVYGTSDIAHREDEIPAPKTFYGLSKLIGEEIVNYYSASRGFRKTVFRLFNSYAPDQPEGFIVPDVIKKYKTQKEVEVVNPDSEIDLVHIDDVIEVLFGALDKGMDGTFNICKGKTTRISEIYAKIKEYTGAKGAGEKIRRSDVKKLTGDNSKITQLGFRFRDFSLP